LSMPAGFEFRLQPLLDRRKRVEEEKQGKCAACRRAVEESGRELARLDVAQRRTAKQLVETALTRPVADVRLREAYLRSVEAAIHDVRRQRGEAETAWERAREELVSASRERRAIEKLKERRREAFEAERARREELELDESNARCYDRSVWKRQAARRAERAAR
jgi:flagellar protein FliJ